jgi:hypothetical protein
VVRHKFSNKAINYQLQFGLAVSELASISIVSSSLL